MEMQQHKKTLFEIVKVKQKGKKVERIPSYVHGIVT
jgi:hypothetical protein